MAEADTQSLGVLQRAEVEKMLQPYQDHLPQERIQSAIGASMQGENLVEWKNMISVLAQASRNQTTQIELNHEQPLAALAAAVVTSRFQQVRKVA
jgi:hypothetical protein